MKDYKRKNRVSLRSAQKKIGDIVEKEFRGNKTRASKYFGCSPSMVRFVITGEQPLTRNMEIVLGFTEKVVEKNVYYVCQDD